MFPVSQSVCSVIRSLRPQERLHFHTKCLLLDCIDSPHRVTLMLLAVIWQNRGQQQLAHGPVLAHQLEHPPDIFFFIIWHQLPEKLWQLLYKGSRPCRKGHLFHWGHNALRQYVRICCHHNLYHQTACCAVKSPVALKAGAYWMQFELCQRMYIM